MVLKNWKFTSYISKPCYTDLQHRYCLPGWNKHSTASVKMSCSAGFSFIYPGWATLLVTLVQRLPNWYCRQGAVNLHSLVTVSTPEQGNSQYLSQSVRGMQPSTEGHQRYFLAVPGSDLSLLSPPLTQAEWNLRVWSLDTQQNTCCGQLFHRGEMLKLRILSLNIQQSTCFASSFTGIEVVKLFFVMWCWHTDMYREKKSCLFSMMLVFKQLYKKKEKKKGGSGGGWGPKIWTHNRWH